MRPATTEESTPPDIATTILVSFGDFFIPSELIINCYIYYKKINLSIMQYDLEPGNFVVNPAQKSWGIGQVQSIIKNKATVNFENAGKQVINLDNINLEKIKNEQ
tara:strand:- start:6 stop:320 length:315 start_codon:yes stop_codon:yes gene_type:complete